MKNVVRVLHRTLGSSFPVKTTPLFHRTSELPSLKDWDTWWARYYLQPPLSNAARPKPDTAVKGAHATCETCWAIAWISVGWPMKRERNKCTGMESSSAYSTGLKSSHKMKRFFAPGLKLPKALQREGKGRPPHE